MKILFMSDTHENKDSGAAGTEYQTIQALRSLGHDVDAIWSEDLRHRITHWNLHHILEQPFEYRRVMLAKLSQKKYDVVHINQPHGYLAAKAIASFNNLIFIHRSHGFEMRAMRDLAPWMKFYGSDKRGFAKRSLSKVVNAGIRYNCRAIARYADGHIVSVSQCAQFLEKSMGIKPECIAVIPQAPPKIYSSSPHKPMGEERRINILYVSQYAFFKAPVVAAEVMNKISLFDDRVKFTWVCSAEHHIEVLKLLSDRTRRQLTLHNWMSQDELLKIYDSHGIFLFPSFFEGFGKVFLEAMSRGLCVVAADNSGAHDIIKHNGNGLLTPTGDIDSVVNECARLLSDSQLAEKISKSAIQTAATYTWERVAESTLTFYQSRLNAKTMRQGKA